MEPGVRPRTKLWLESDGRLVMSDYRLRLLKGIAETGSLAAAAEQMGLSYRRAWGKIRELEANVGTPLVASAAGGAGGGGSRLTSDGEALIARYERFAVVAEAAVEAAYREVFNGGRAPKGGAASPPATD